MNQNLSVLLYEASSKVSFPLVAKWLRLKCTDLEFRVVPRGPGPRPVQKVLPVTARGGHRCWHPNVPLALLQCRQCLRRRLVAKPLKVNWMHVLSRPDVSVHVALLQHSLGRPALARELGRVPLHGRSQLVRGRPQRRADAGGVVRAGGDGTARGGGREGDAPLLVLWLLLLLLRGLARGCGRGRGGGRRRRRSLRPSAGRA
mmetsp:Transcript_4046/g.7124  ORF Transcript_4046/g.7124 Transcript_4046/m.7124 type:complete len:202 (-) Transcript_4046:243-848(-)